jgi:hypothetical protein
VLAQPGSTTDGLSSPEAAKHLAVDGPNKLTEGKCTSPPQIFLGQFKSLIMLKGNCFPGPFAENEMI